MSGKDHLKDQKNARTQRSAESSAQESRNQDRLERPAAMVGKARLAPELLTPPEILRLGRQIGNRAVCQLLTPPRQTVSPVCQRQESEEEEAVQAKSDGYSSLAQQPHQSPQAGTGNGLPERLKSGLEALSGLDLSHVRVHENDPGPAKLNALAYAQGGNIHLGPGQEKHLPHEGWHVVQQMQGRVNATLQEPEVAINDDQSLEHEADAMGEQAVQLSRSETMRREGMTASPWMTVNSAARSHHWGTRAVQRRDQHAGTRVPGATEQAAIAGELYPARGAAGAPPQPWDGAMPAVFDPAGVLRAAANRGLLINKMHTALNASLAATMPGITATAARRRLPIASLEGAGRAAKADVDAKFGSYATASALTVSQAAARAAYSISASGPGQNLFDAQDPTDRATVGMAIDPTDLASWMAETVPACVTARNFHHLDPTRSAEERNFLRTQIIAPFVAANTANLRAFDLHGFALSNPATGQIVLPTSVPGGLSDVAPRPGRPSPAERGRKWRAWRTMVHEYIHQLEHPALRSWPGSNRTVSEGFCEYFTKKVLRPLLPTAAGRDVTRRTLIEGANNGTPSAAIIGGAYSPGSYAEYLRRAENIERHLGGAAIGAQNAMKAIFFQGHLEFLGYDPQGNAVSAAPGRQDRITVPSSITTFAALSTATNVRVSALRRANPGATEPLSGRMRAPGCREHRVVIAGAHGSGARGESLAVIATQNGVSQAALTAANPGVNFAALRDGDVVIIPRH